MIDSMHVSYSRVPSKYQFCKDPRGSQSPQAEKSHRTYLIESLVLSLEVAHGTFGDLDGIGG